MAGAETTPNLRQTDFLILAVLRDGPLHGYGIVQQIEEISDGAVSLRPGDVYRVLYRMQRDGYLTETGEAETPTGRRTNYTMTDHGRRVLESQAELLAQVAGRVLSDKGIGHVG